MSTNPSGRGQLRRRRSPSKETTKVLFEMTEEAENDAKACTKEAPGGMTRMSALEAENKKLRAQVAELERRLSKYEDESTKPQEEQGTEEEGPPSASRKHQGLVPSSSGDQFASAESPSGSSGLYHRRVPKSPGPKHADPDTSEDLAVSPLTDRSVGKKALRSVNSDLIVALPLSPGRSRPVKEKHSDLEEGGEIVDGIDTVVEGDRDRFPLLDEKGDSTVESAGADNQNNDEVRLEDAPFGQMVSDRAGWLVGLLVLQSMSSFIIQRNEEMLGEHLAIVQFLTMLVGAGGNAGNQASVRGKSICHERFYHCSFARIHALF